MIIQPIQGCREVSSTIPNKLLVMWIGITAIQILYGAGLEPTHTLFLICSHRESNQCRSQYELKAAQAYYICSENTQDIIEKYFGPMIMPFKASCFEFVLRESPSDRGILGQCMGSVPNQNYEEFRQLLTCSGNPGLER